MVNFSSFMPLQMKICMSVFKTDEILAGPECSACCNRTCSSYCQPWKHLTSICDSSFQHFCVAYSDWALHV